MEGRKKDWEEARRVGVDVGSVRWFDEEEMKEVGLQDLLLLEGCRGLNVM